MRNADIRHRAAESDVKLWEIASALSLTDGNFSRKLRVELKPEEKMRIYEIIDRIREER